MTNLIEMISNTRSFSKINEVNEISQINKFIETKFQEIIDEVCRHLCIESQTVTTNHKNTIKTMSEILHKSNENRDNFCNDSETIIETNNVFCDLLNQLENHIVTDEITIYIRRIVVIQMNRIVEIFERRRVNLF